MQFTHEHNQTPVSVQDMLALAGGDRRTAFRIWQLTPEGKTLTELGKALGMTGCGVSVSLNNERMPVRHHQALVAAGVPEHLLPRPEDVPTGPKPKKKE